MKPLVLDGSACRRSHSRVVVILIILVLLPCFSFTLFTCSLAADDQASKAVRRSSSEEPKKVALVIGNSKYVDALLRNPANDAEDFASALRALGFSVQTRINGNQRDMEEAVSRFAQEIQQGYVALFYFSGHRVQVKGKTILFPLESILNRRVIFATRPSMPGRFLQEWKNPEIGSIF